MTRLTRCMWCLWAQLFMSGASVQAAVVDSGEIHFRGMVRDNAPRWVWNIATPEQNWDVNAEDAERDLQGNQLFDLSQKGTLRFLEGYLEKVAAQGGSGMIPVITLFSGNQPLARLSGDSATGQRYHVAIPVFNASTGEEIGELSFVFEQGLVVARGREARLPILEQLDNQMALVSGDTVPIPNPGLLSPLLVARLGELIASNGGRTISGRPTLAQRVVGQSLLSNSHTRNIAAAYASQLSGFSLRWPQEKIPTRWKATLNVSVTVL